MNLEGAHFTKCIFFLPGDAIDACYTRVNTLGNVFGHCGVSETDYLPCSEE